MAARQRPGVVAGTTRAAIYCRVSSAGQEDNSSLETQEAACRAYAAEHDWSVVQVYREVHTGAELFERPRLTLLREAMRRREFDVLLVHALDRLSRKQTHQGLVLSEAEHAGVRWDSATEDIDDSPQGQILRAVIGGMAEMERLKIAERTQRGTRARATAGKLLAGCRPLFGYRWRGEDKGAYDIDPVTSAVVRRIFADFLGGKSLRAIARDLATDGVPTPTGKLVPWAAPTIAVILKNPAYAGTAAAFRYHTERRQGGGTRVTLRPADDQVALPEGTIPAIVSSAEHEAAVARLQYNRAVSSRNNMDPEATLLRAGLVRCGYCGGSLAVKHPRCGHARRTVYCCNGVNRDRHGCPSVTVSAPRLDAAVWARVTEVLLQPEVIAAEVDRRRERSSVAADLAIIEQRLAAIERQRRNLIRAIALLADDADSVALMTRELSGLGEQHRQLEGERAAKAAQSADEAAENGRLVDLAAWCGRAAGNLGTLIYTEQRMILEALGVGVRVWQAKHAPRWEMTMALLPIRPESPIEFRTAPGRCGRPPRRSARSSDRGIAAARRRSWHRCRPGHRRA